MLVYQSVPLFTKCGVLDFASNSFKAFFEVSRPVLSGVNRFSGYSGRQKLHHQLQYPLGISCVATEKGPIYHDLSIISMWFSMGFQ